MESVLMHLALEHSDHYGSPTLYRKEMRTGFRPHKGERVTLFPHPRNVGVEENAADGPMGIVREVYWGADGTLRLDMEHFVVDPSEWMVLQVRTSFNSSYPLHAWYSERDGNLVALLMAGGWDAL